MLCKNLSVDMLNTLKAIPLNREFKFGDIDVHPPSGVIQRLREENYIDRVSRDHHTGSTWIATSKVQRVIEE